MCSDVHGRRPHLLTAVALAMASGVLFIAWSALPGLFAARILCGISVGLTVSTATAYLSESHRAQGAASSPGRPQFTAAAANLGGLSLGALLTGMLAQYAGHPLVLPYVVLLGALALAAVAVALSPETRDRQRPLPACRPQRVSAPQGARAPYFAALTGVFLAGGGVVGAAAATLFKGTLGGLIAISPAGRLGEALAGFFLSGYLGLSVPAIAVGVALQFVSPRGTLLAFAIVVSAGTVGALPLMISARRGDPGLASRRLPSGGAG